MTLLTEIEAVLVGRREHAPAESYSATLLADPERVTRKVMEEAFELCLELNRPVVSEQRATEEAADLVFHLLAALVGAGVSFDGVLAELARRRASAPATGFRARPEQT